MAASSSSQWMISASSSCAFFSSRSTLQNHKWQRRLKGTNNCCSRFFFSVAASSSSSSSPSSSEDSDCNVEECAPDKEVGKVSVEWLVGEKTKVVGTYPPRKRGWTGYIEKDTAGQTNVYSVEPAVYVADSAISSGSSGTSADGAENTAAIAAGLALISIAAASSILLQVSKNSPQMQTTEYLGPPLSYYISKFKPVTVVEAVIPAEVQNSLTVQPESSTPEVRQVQEAPQVQVELINDQVGSTNPSISSSS